MRSFVAKLNGAANGLKRGDVVGCACSLKGLHNLNRHGDEANTIGKEEFNHKIDDPTNDGEEQEHTRLNCAERMPATGKLRKRISKHESDIERKIARGQAMDEHGAEDYAGADQQLPLVRLQLCPIGIYTVTAEVGAVTVYTGFTQGFTTFGAITYGRLIWILIAIDRTPPTFYNIIYNINIAI